MATKKAVLADLDCSDDEALLRKLSALSVEMMRQTAALEDALAAPHGKNAYEAAHYYRYTVFEIMGKLRASVDAHHLQGLLALSQLYGAAVLCKVKKHPDTRMAQSRPGIRADDRIHIYLSMR